MHRLHLALAIALASIVITAASRAARADTGNEGDGFIIVGGFEGTTGGITRGELAREWSVDGGGFGPSVGVRYRRVELSGRFAVGFYDSANLERDTKDLTAIELATDVGYHVRITDGLDLVVRAGWRWRRLAADSYVAVTRTCNETRECVGGWWSETPTYWASGPTFALGVEDRWRLDTHFIIGMRLEAELGRLQVALPGDDGEGVYVGGRATFLFGGAWRN
jgi:hypothetical protein